MPKNPETKKQWLERNVAYDGDGCLTWPFHRLPNGYGMFGYNINGTHKTVYAHRYMCELVNGPPGDLHAAHSCGRGKDGCVDPRHLSWKTRTENALDCRGHGTQRRNDHGNAGRLTPAQVNQIRALKGFKTQAQIAEQFRISEPTVRDIFLGRSHRPDRRLHRFSAEDDAAIMSGNPKLVAAERGLSYQSVRKRVRLLKAAATSGQSEPESK